MLLIPILPAASSRAKLLPITLRLERLATLRAFHGGTMYRVAMRLLSVIFGLLWIPSLLFGQGTPVRHLSGSGVPSGSVASVEGTEYVDTSVSPPVNYVCTSISIATGPTPPAGTITCNWTAAGGGGGISSNVPVTCASSTAFPVGTTFITDFFLTLNCNVTSSSMTGTLVTGNEVTFTITQSTGNNTFVFPPGFLNTPPIALPAGATTVATFQYCGSIGNGAGCPANSWQNTDVGPAGVAASSIQTAWQKVGPVVYGGTTGATAVQEPTVFITPTAQVVSNPANGAPVLGMFHTLGAVATTLVYKESLDGVNWFPSAISIAATHLHSCVAITGGTMYILAANAVSGANGIDIYSGADAGHLTLLKANIVTNGGGGWKSTSLGNCGFWHDLDGTWRLLYDGYNGTVFQVGEATCTAPSGTMTCTDFGSNPILSNGTGIIGDPKSIKQIGASSYIMWPHATPSGVAGAVPTDGYFATATSPTGPWTVTTNSVLYRTTAIEGVNTAVGQVADLAPVTFNGSCFMYNTAFPNGNTLVNGAAELSIANTPCESMSSVTQTIASPPRIAIAGADTQVIFNSQGQETATPGFFVTLPGANLQVTVGGANSPAANVALNVTGKAGGNSILNIGTVASAAPAAINIAGSTTVTSLSQSGASGNGGISANGFWSATAYQTATNCAVNGVSPAACGSAASGVFAIPASQTSYTVNTTAVTANSRIILQPVTDNTGIPSAPTCADPSFTASTAISSRVAGTSFSVALTSNAGITCYNYWIVN